MQAELIVGATHRNVLLKGANRVDNGSARTIPVRNNANGRRKWAKSKLSFNCDGRTIQRLLLSGINLFE